MNSVFLVSILALGCGLATTIGGVALWRRPEGRSLTAVGALITVGSASQMFGPALPESVRLAVSALIFAASLVFLVWQIGRLREIRRQQRRG